MRFCLMLGAVCAPALLIQQASAQKTQPGNYGSSMNENRRALSDWKQYYRYDYDRPEPRRRTYYANRYYRDGRYYAPRTLAADDRIYRGADNRYYCRRPDGTTGLIVAGLNGGRIGKGMAAGDSRLLGDGPPIDEPAGAVVCR